MNLPDYEKSTDRIYFRCKASEKQLWQERFTPRELSRIIREFLNRKAKGKHERNQI
jgi:hypothetical protein